MKQIGDFCKAAEGAVVDGSSIDIGVGCTVGLYVERGLDQSGKIPQNSIALFTGFKSPDALD